MITDRLALIAGDGLLPEILAKRLFEKKNISLIVVLQGSKDRFNMMREIVHESPPGKVNKILDLLKKNKINKLIMVGKIDKSAFLERRGFDFKALQLARKIKNGNDMSIFNVVQYELKKINIEILPQYLFLRDMIVQKGILTRKRPSKTEIENAKFGIEYAKLIAGMDIGQAVVVNNKVITAVEAVEGTNETIKRGAGLRKKGSVVCKAGRPNQDNRFDIPTVGLDTLKIMAEYFCSTLAVEANKIFIIDPDEVIKYADSKGISIIGM